MNITFIDSRRSDIIFSFEVATSLILNVGISICTKRLIQFIYDIPFHGPTVGFKYCK